MVLDVTNHWGKANQNQSDLPPHTCQDDYLQKDQRCVGEDMEKREADALLVGMETDATAMEKVMEFPQKTKNGVAI